ncbi:MAG: hypothetical protein ACHQRM_10770 [Bacteroidia bacterium]
MSEKRYFRIFSERHTIGSENKYVALFQQLEKCEKEEDAVLIRNLKKQGVNADFISADKNYLYHLILKSLNDFHDSRTYNLEIKEALLSVEILFHKGLYPECLKLIAKAEALAQECENFQLMIDLLMWKKKCCGYSLGLKKAAEVNRSMDHYIRLLSNLKNLTDLYYESSALVVNNELSPEKEVKKKFTRILSKPELASEKGALSFSALAFYHLTRANYFNSANEVEKEYKQLQKLVDMLNSSLTYALENPLDYVSIYNRLLAIKKYLPASGFFQDLGQLKSFANKVEIRKEIVIQRVFIHANTHELEYYLIHGKIEQALTLTKEIKKQLSKVNEGIEPYHMIYYYYLHAIILIFSGQNHEALRFINKTLLDFHFDDRPQVYMRVEVLSVLMHFELKNFGLVVSIARQLEKEDKKQSILIPIEYSLLAAVVRISSARHTTLKEEAQAFQSLALELKDAKKGMHRFGNNLLENYDKWIKAKLKRTTVLELGHFTV